MVAVAAIAPLSELVRKGKSVGSCRCALDLRTVLSGFDIETHHFGTKGVVLEERAWFEARTTGVFAVGAIRPQPSD